jgi:hypothetical protein
LLRRFGGFRPLIAAVSEDPFDERKLAARAPVEHQRNAVAVLNIGGEDGQNPDASLGYRKDNVGILINRSVARAYSASLESEYALDSFAWSHFLTANRSHFAGKRSKRRRF